ncbi:hypothetical protein SDC9_177896 [bioreactor metagenome]|uniref:Uncharacterized protein n=1 Tax=bioreactor metagenome TaxID=1076179 RepID=A0A645GUH3_9ZZZZ
MLGKAGKHGVHAVLDQREARGGQLVVRVAAHAHVDRQCTVKMRRDAAHHFGMVLRYDTQPKQFAHVMLHCRGREAKPRGELFRGDGMPAERHLAKDALTLRIDVDVQLGFTGQGNDLHGVRLLSRYGYHNITNHVTSIKKCKVI